MTQRTMRGKMRRLAPSALVAIVVVVAGTAFFPLQGARASSGTFDETFNSDGLPDISGWQFVSAGPTPPTQAQCVAIHRRCFDPAAMANSYDYASLHAAGTEGQGTTIAIVDSFGSATIANDLNVFDNAFLPFNHLCGEANYTCKAGDPTFKVLEVQGSPPAVPPPPNNGTGQEAHNLWAGEVSLDVEWAHATAPMANILLVTTPTAETLGVQGFQQMMNAEQYVVDNHLADVISQSFGAGEGTFGSNQSLLNLRQAFIDAQANHVTVLASSGDNGTANPLKEPVKAPNLIPYPSVGWPASDPLVTAVGGTYLCTNASTGTGVDSVNPPSACQAAPGVREVGWIAGGGGYSTIFSRPSYQDTLPPGSTYTGTSVGAPGPNSNMRGVPDIAYQASSLTGVLIYDSNPIGSNVGDAGWDVIGGTSSGSPQWAGLVAMADQLAHEAHHGDIGFMNPSLYQFANNPAKYAADFQDITFHLPIDPTKPLPLGCNQLVSTIPGYCDSTGWDAVTGLGSPNAANLLPDLAALAS